MALRTYLAGLLFLFLLAYGQAAVPGELHENVNKPALAELAEIESFLLTFAMPAPLQSTQADSSIENVSS